MKIKIFLLILLLVTAIESAGVIKAGSAQDEQKPDENRLFYTGGVYYEKKDYEKAIANYRAALGMGLESGNLYYNMGNAYLKTGRYGYAILFYEKAKRLIPQDGDLKSNLIYARSMVPGQGAEPDRKLGFASKVIKAPFGDINLNAVAITALVLYMLIVMTAIFFMLNPYRAKKIRFLLILLLIVFLWSAAAFAIRYYEDEFLKKGVTVVKSADARFEPIDDSTAFYKLQEGDEVVVLNTRDGWRRVIRSDGKVGWVSESAVEEI